ncbi:hypothetical protein [Acidithiobacillus sp.]|uniref:hypothetical protein n=1 Tax=Acidithiobacillus sp. TaxID=1872118 RepID=UPI00262331EA|nr:hypothetical protein [Acidithiobacillus sp.]MDD5279525.1 hypothetical protein [Acidithiobacillus sp.]
MRTVNELEAMIQCEAKVRIWSKAGPGNATISAWPSAKVIYMHPDWLDEGKATDAETKECLMHELGHRKDWVFTGIGLLAAAGFFWMLAAVVWNLFVAPILNANLGAGLPIDRYWIAYGMALVVMGTLMRLALYKCLERRADYFCKKMSA